MAKFVYLCVVSPQNGKAHSLAEAYGAGKPRLNLSNIRQTLIPLPPLAAQIEIVARVNRLFALADSLQARFDKAHAFFDRMSGALLAKAFRGELVPPNPDDESAAIMPERLRAHSSHADGVAASKEALKTKSPRKARAKKSEQTSIF